MPTCIIATNRLKRLVRVRTIVCAMSLSLLSFSGYGQESTKQEHALAGYIANAESSSGTANFRARYAWLAAQTLLTGDGVRVDQERGQKYLDMAATAGDPQITYNVAVYYLSEENGSARNIEKGMKYLKKSSLGGFPLAMYEQARIKLEGYEINGVILVNPKPIEALVDMRSAANSDFPHPRAQALYGKMLIEGYPKTKPLKSMTAIKYLEKAAGNGSTEGIDYLKNLLTTDPEIKAVYEKDNQKINKELTEWVRQINQANGNQPALEKIKNQVPYDLFFTAGLRSYFGLGIKPMEGNAVNYWLFEMNKLPSPYKGTAYLVGLVFIQQSEQAQKDIGTKILQSLAQSGHYGALATLQNRQ